MNKQNNQNMLYAIVFIALSLLSLMREEYTIMAVSIVMSVLFTLIFLVFRTISKVKNYPLQTQIIDETINKYNYSCAGADGLVEAARQSGNVLSGQTIIG